MMVVSFLQLLTNAFAQQNYITSLQKLVDAAQHHFPILQQKLALISGAKAQVTYVKHQYLPQTNVGDEVSLGTDNSLPGAFLPINVLPSVSGGIRAKNNFQPSFGNVASLYGDVQLSNFGLKDARVRLAESYVGLAQGDLEKEAYLIKWNLAKTYFELLRQAYQSSADRQNINRYDSIYKVIEAIALAGIRPGADTSLALAELSKSRINYNQTLGKIAQAKQQLSYWSGLPVNQISVDTGGEAMLELVHQVGGIYADSANNPLIDYYNKQSQVYQSNEQVAKKSFQPKLLLATSVWARGSGIDYDNTYKPLETGLGYQRFNYAAGISFTYDLFSPIHKRDKLAIAHFNTLASNNELEQQRLLLQNVNEQANEAIKTSTDNLAELPVQQASAEAVYQQKIAQYRAGIISLIDLTNASFVLFRSQVDYIETINGLLVASLDKAAATGNIDRFIQLIKN